MHRRTRHRLLGLVALAVLLALAGWQYLADRARDPGTLLDLAPASVHRIEVVRGKAAPQRYLRQGGHWYRVGADRTRVDDGRLDELAATAAVRVLEWRPLGDFDPAHIGLEPPQLVLVLNGHRLVFGALSAVGPQRYVRVGSRVALIPAVDTPRPPLADTVRKQL
jgi:hypothetical protein